MGGRRPASLRLFVVAPIAAILAASALTAQQAGRPAVGARGVAVARAPQVGYAVGFAVSPPVGDLPEQVLSKAVDAGADATVPVLPLPRRERLAFGTSTGDGMVQTYAPPLIPLPTLSFDGLSSQDNQNVVGVRPVPPDTNGDVGPNHYVQTVNVLVRVYNKTGVPLTAPFKMSTLFASLSSSLCATNNNGDPIVLYDPLADRWLLSQFAFASGSPPPPPYHQCIAISTTGDPTGSYFLYDFIMPGSNLNDYPKFGVWADGYYMTDNQFLNGGPFNGAGAFAFDGAKMRVGDPTASFIYFDLGADFGGMLPADVDGSTPPPPGAPNYFAMLESDELGLPEDAPSAAPTDSMRLFSFHADFTTPSASTFIELPESPVSVAAFDPRRPSGRSVIEQPPPATSSSYVDAIQDRLMHRLAYRNFGGARESLVVTHTVNVGLDPTTVAGHQAAIRYYEFRRNLPGGAFTVPEQATFAPDTDNRWMGSAAMDGQGNIAVGYSVSSLTTFPSIRYAGRLASDPPNGLFQGEGVLAIGSGVQLSTSGRWGDYSALSVDPADDCTFWYTTEYYTAASQATSSVGWLTRIGTFRFPNCGPQGPQGTVTGLVTDVVTGAPVPGAVLSFNPGGSAVLTDQNGIYRATVPTGTYSLTASVPNHPFQSVFGVVVTNGGTTTLNFALSLPPSAGILVGHVRSAATNAPLANALVTAGSVSTTTDGTGLYSLNLPAGTYTVTAFASVYVAASTSAVVSNQALTTRDFALVLPTNTGFLTGHVRSATTNAPIASAVVSVGASSTTTDVLGAYSLFLTAAPYTVTASANDYLNASAGVVVSNQLVTSRDLALQPVVFTQAAYAPTLSAPQCGQPGAACDSGTLLVGRDTLSGGAEPNQPNTILNSCADGTAGSFHLNESLDRLEIYTLDGGAFAAGKTVKIQATVWALSPSDRLDLYYTANASNPSWTFLTTLVPPGPGAQTLSATYVLPAGSLQAVRGNYRFSGTVGLCTTGTSDDRDDLMFVAIPDPGTVAGQVTDALTGVAIAGTVLSLSPGGVSAAINGNGNYAATVPAGTYTLTASAPGHVSQSVSGVVITNGGTVTENFVLSLAASTGVITGHVRDATTNAPIANAVVQAIGGSLPTPTDANGLYTIFLSPATFVLTVAATGYVTASDPSVVVSDQATTTRDFALQPVMVVQAAYDATLKTPRCGVGGGVCDSGTLLVGRDTLPGGAEPNQPNTILNSCFDGTLGSFHSDESVDRIRISTLDGGTFAPGKTIRIDTTVWVFSSSVDLLEVYAATNANSPSWTLIATVAPSVASGAATLSTTYVLPAGGLQAVRARYRDSTVSPALTPCAGSTGNFDDTDDLIFSTFTPPGSPAFTTQPSNQTVTAGQTATFTVAATGTPATSQTVGSATGDTAAIAFASSPSETRAMTSAPGTSSLTANTSSVVESPAILTVPAGASTLTAAVSGVVVSNAATTPQDLALQPAASTIQPFTSSPTATRFAAPSPRAQVFTATAVARVRKWEIELYGGGMLANHPAGGTATMPGPGQPFNTANGNPSRLESSWYFGDGASLLNQVNAALGVPQRMTPLDGVLNSSVAQRERGGAFGLRGSRIINPRYTAEVSVEYTFGRLDLTSAGSSGIDASRAAFISTWNGLLSVPGFSGSTVTATAKTIRPGRQLFTTGAVNIALKQGQKMIPYVTVGAGVISNLGDAPSTSLTGNYQFLFAGATSIHETDSVTLRYVVANHVFVSVIGGGLKYYASPRWGVRLDARLYLSPNTIDTLVDASPRVFTLTPAGSVAAATNPSIQFSNSPTTGIQSSLSAPSTTGVRTFAGGGVQSQLSVTAGIFRRF